METNKVVPLNTNHIILLGIPFDQNSSFLRGCAEGPRTIREILYSGSSNAFTEDGQNLERDGRFIDQGDLTITKYEDANHLITETISNLYHQKNRAILLGGDHSITYPIVRGIKQTIEPFIILHFDAHSDTYPIFDGNIYSHACPFARIMEEKLVSRLIQVGIRTLTAEQREQIARFNIEVFEMKDWGDDREIELDFPVYLSVDLDVFDPAFAPGVSHHEPGGMTTRQVIKMIQHLQVPIVGADIVEYNPRRDHTGITGALAAKLIKEIYAKMVMNSQ